MTAARYWRIRLGGQTNIDLKDVYFLDKNLKRIVPSSPANVLSSPTAVNSPYVTYLENTLFARFNNTTDTGDGTFGRFIGFYSEEPVEVFYYQVIAINGSAASTFVERSNDGVNWDLISRTPWATAWGELRHPGGYIPFYRARRVLSSSSQTGALTTAQHWRIAFPLQVNNGLGSGEPLGFGATIAEAKFSEGQDGPNVVGPPANSSAIGTPNDPQLAFDGDLQTFFRPALSSYQNPFSILQGYSFEPVTIRQIAWTPSDENTARPEVIVLQSSADGIDWRTVQTFDAKPPDSGVPQYPASNQWPAFEKRLFPPNTIPVPEPEPEPVFKRRRQSYIS
jgi:hypothetical protein